MTHEIAEGLAMVDAVRRFGRVYQTGSQQRSDFQGMFRRAAELVLAGAVGQLQAIHIGIGGPPEDDFTLPVQPVPSTLDWDMWVGPAPWRPYNATLCPLNFRGFPQWRHYRDFGGGGYNDMGAHHFDIAQWAMAMDNSGPIEIYPPDGKEHKYLTYRYSNGVPMYHGGDDRGSIVFHGRDGSIFVSRAFLRADPVRILDFKLGPNHVHLNRYRNHRDDWLHCIKTRQRPIADVEIGHRTATVCHLGLITYRLNRPLAWDPVSEQFVNDDDANRLRSRALRTPWRV
jgi:predicted dehydrogenase